MLTLLMFGYIGTALQAPAWYWVCFGVHAFVYLVKMGIELAKDDDHV